jgi:hypothetical protein
LVRPQFLQASWQGPFDKLRTSSNAPEAHKPAGSAFKISAYKFVVYAQSLEPKQLFFDLGSRIGCDNPQLDIATTLHSLLLTVPQNAADSYNLQSGRPANQEFVFGQADQVFATVALQYC